MTFDPLGEPSMSDLRRWRRALAGALLLSAPARAYLDKSTRDAQRMENLTQDILE